ncbi:ribose phosphate diphosphokinase subunit prs4 [Mucor velutinosus]|uniref:Ribose phosphate diphosphokinase subunit prs4 n=1 Tax=Mucor velutinosus TaxID=708070 RepID=A0AAN7HLY4_9FUNG|nr:ribose phosphate diphosphokinase subunit prs4 [Mucor velutinosus]
MSDANPFGALNEAEDTYDTSQEGQQKDASFFEIKSLVPDVKIKLPDAQVAQTKNHISLLACSSSYGYFIAATANGFCLGHSQKMREIIYQTQKGKIAELDNTIQVVVSQGKVNHVSLSADQLQLFVAVLGGTLLTYNVHDIVQQKEAATPSHTYSVGCEIVSLQPNPEAYPDIIAILTNDNRCELIQNNDVIAIMHNAHSICWSPKGKQIACGSSAGSIMTYDIEGNQKDEVPPPEALENDPQSERIVDTLVWIENHVFFVFYSHKVDEEYNHRPYIVNRKKQTQEEKYVLMDEVLPVLAMECPKEYFYTAVVRNIGPDAKTVIIITNAAANELNVVGQGDDDQWATWILENSPSLPLSTDDVEDTYPVGLAVDYSASEPLPPFDPAENDTPVPPMPVLYIMTTDGLLLSYHIYNTALAESGAKYDKMIEAMDFNTIPMPQKSTSVTTAPATKSDNKLPNAFALANDTGAAPSFGFNAAGSAPKFASLARSSSTETKLPQPVSAFGSTSTFGQSSGFGQPAFGSTTAFGSSSFGSAAPQMGQNTGNTPSFGGFKNMVKQPKKASTTTSFAPSTLASETSTVAEKASSTGDEEHLQSTSTFGQPSAFGQPSVFGQPSKFGQSSTFGQPSLSGQNLFGAKSFTSPSTFTSKSTTTKDTEDESAKGAKQIEEPSEKSSEKPPQDETPLPTTGTTDAVPSQNNTLAKPIEEKEPEAPTDALSHKEKEEETTTTNNKDEQDAVAPIVQLASDMGDQQAPLSPTTSDDKEKDDQDKDNEDGGCSMSFEQVQRALDNDDVDVKSGSDFTKSDSNQDNEDGYQNDVNSEDDYFDEQDQTGSEQESNEDDEEAKEAQKRAITEEERQAEKERRAKEERLAEEKRIEEEKRAADEKRAAEDKRLAEEKRLEEVRLAEAKRIEDERIARAKRLEEERVAEEKRLKEERIAEEERLEAERIAAVKPDIKFFRPQRLEQTAQPHTRSKNLTPMAAEFEELYFSTLEDMDNTSLLLQNIQEDLYIRNNDLFNPKTADAFEDYDCEWKMADNDSMLNIIQDLNSRAKSAEMDAKYTKESTIRISRATEQMKDDRNLIGDYINSNDFEKPLESPNMVNELQDKQDYLQTKDEEIKALFDTLDSKLAQMKKAQSASKLPSRFSSMKKFELEKIIRDTRRGISASDDRIFDLASQELKFRNAKKHQD